MNPGNPTRFTYLAIILIQVPLVLTTLAWYPQLAERLLLLATQGPATGAGPTVGGGLLSIALLLSPVLLFLAPYPIARAFWHRMERWTTMPA